MFYTYFYIVLHLFLHPCGRTALLWRVGRLTNTIRKGRFRCLAPHTFPNLLTTKPPGAFVYLSGLNVYSWKHGTSKSLEANDRAIAERLTSTTLTTGRLHCK